MIRFFIFFTSVFCFTLIATGQDSAYAIKIITKLSSPGFHGRGYIKNGDGKAAGFIVQELKNQGVSPLGQNYLQTFNIPVNTFGGKMELYLDGSKLVPVDQFVVAPDCPSVKGNFPIVYLPAEADTNNHLYDSLLTVNFGNVIVVAPFPKRKINRENPFKSAGMIYPVRSAVWWAYGNNKTGKSPVIHIVDTLLKAKPQAIKLNIESQLIRHQTQNIAACCIGSVQPDTFIVFTAHYDHLGKMGKRIYFPGANDNASGTAMVLSLAKQFTHLPEKPYYSVAFLFFAAEEVGLLGSDFYVQNPLFPLQNIKALINLDMVGSGSEGISLFNGEKNPGIVSVIDSLNKEYHFLPNLKVRGESCNSDQCYFDRKGVPAIFICTEGKECPYYHVRTDNIEHTPLTRFNQLEMLMMMTANALSNSK